MTYVENYGPYSKPVLIDSFIFQTICTNRRVVRGMPEKCVENFFFNLFSDRFKFPRKNLYNFTNAARLDEYICIFFSLFAQLLQLVVLY